MRKSARAFFNFFVFITIAVSACVSHDFPQYVCDEEYSFAGDVKPILETKCAISGCHNGDMGSDLDWNNFAAFRARVESGEVKFRVTNRIMPPSDSHGGPLTQEQIDAIACWSDQGALNN